MTDRPMLGGRMALAMVYLERYGLSLVFLGMAGFRLHRVITMGAAERAEIDTSPVIAIIRQIVWIQLYAAVGLLLLLGRRVQTPPQRLRDILIPVGTTFFNLAYDVIPWLPLALRKSLCPPAWQTVAVTSGLALNLIGLWIAVWAAMHLSRSFGILIEVRQVVLAGAYRRLRHPMYLGYLCFLAGLALANFSAACFVLVAIHTALILYRAHLEETRLAEHSPAYREYCKHSGFIFPKLRRS